MKKLIEFKIVVYLSDEASVKDEVEEMLDNLENPVFMGALSSDNGKEKLVTYGFSPDTIVNVRETFVEYQQQWLPAVVCSFIPNKKGKIIIQTPALLTSYKEFKERVDEYYKEEYKA